jgi:hypothetical protein
MVFCEKENASTELKADSKEARSLPYSMHTTNCTTESTALQRIFQNYGNAIKHLIFKSKFLSDTKNNSSALLQ